MGSPPKVAVLGKSGTGKTTLCRVLVRSMMPNIVVWDPVGQYPAEVAYRPRDMSSRDEGEWFAGRILDRAPYNVLWEEAEQVWDQQRGLLPARANELALVGRNYGCGWLVNVRRPQAVHKTFMDEADDLFIFKLEGRALEATKDRVGRQVAPKLDVMTDWAKGDHRFFHYRDGILAGPKTLDIGKGAP